MPPAVLYDELASSRSEWCRVRAGPTVTKLGTTRDMPPPVPPPPPPAPPPPVPPPPPPPAPGPRGQQRNPLRMGPTADGRRGLAAQRAAAADVVLRDVVAAVVG